MIASLAVPIFGFGMNLAMTEGPLLFGWMLVLWALWRARNGALGWWVAAGTGVGIAAMSKYTAVFLLPAMMLVTAADPAIRREARRLGPWFAAVPATLALVPVVVWNGYHHWASFVFQTTSRYGLADVVPTQSLTSIAGQLIVLTPVLFCGIAASVAWWAPRGSSDPRGIWVLAFGLPLPLFMVLQSPWSLVKLNWLAPAYLSLLIGVVLWIESQNVFERFPRWAVASRATIAAGLMLMLASPGIAELIPWSAANQWSGWNTVAARAEFWEDQLDGEDGEEGNVFFFSIGEVLPGSVLGGRGLAFDFWALPNSMVGKDAVAVIPSDESLDNVRATLLLRFTSVRLAETVEVRSLGGVPVRQATLWICRGYDPPASTISGSGPS